MRRAARTFSSRPTGRGGRLAARVNVFARSGRVGRPLTVEQSGRATRSGCRAEAARGAARGGRLGLRRAVPGFAGPVFGARVGVWPLGLPSARAQLGRPRRRRGRALFADGARGASRSAARREETLESLLLPDGVRRLTRRSEDVRPRLKIAWARRLLFLASRTSRMGPRLQRRAGPRLPCPTRRRQGAVVRPGA